MAWMMLYERTTSYFAFATGAMIDKIDNQLGVQRAALAALTYRQEILASNIANADTPNFKARDIDFTAAMNAALAGRRNGDLGLTATSTAHISAGVAPSIDGALKYRTEFQPSADGNTVNMDVERAAFAENALRLEAALTFIRSDLKDLQLAMSQ